MPRLVQARSEKSVRRKSRRKEKLEAEREANFRRKELHVAADKAGRRRKKPQRGKGQQAQSAAPSAGRQALSARQRPSFIELLYLKRLQLVNWPRECPLRHRPSSRR